MKKKILVTALVAAMAAPAAWAANDGASCGVGSSVMAGKSGRSAHITASVIDTAINAVVGGLVTSGMTSGTLGCDTSTMVQKDQEKNLFVAMNVEGLSHDMARGKGAYLQSVARLMGVEDQPAFARAAQQAFQQALASGAALTPTQLIQQLDTAQAQLG